MAVSQETVRRILELSGLRPSAKQVETTARLYDILGAQLAKASAESLENVEPQHIQPPRREGVRGRRRRQSRA